MIVGLVCCSLSLSCFAPVAAWSRHHHHGGYRHSGHGGGNALAWGLTGLFVGSALTGLAYQSSAQPVYQPPVAIPTTPYPPDVPPGMCRWERYVLDSHGRALFDAYGQPVKEYSLGSCQYPPY